MAAVPIKFSAKPKPRPAPAPAAFLPMSRAEMDARGWDELDVLIITGDAYVDHPSFGAAMIGRVLEAEGLRVGIIAQPDWTQTGSIEVVFADSAYGGAPLEKQMDAKGVVRCAVEPARRGAPLTAQEEESNQRIARVRARVEHVFALMSGQAGRIFQRYIGRARNAAAIVLMNWVYNLQRYEQILRLDIQVA